MKIERLPQITMVSSGIALLGLFNLYGAGKMAMRLAQQGKYIDLALSLALPVAYLVLSAAFYLMKNWARQALSAICLFQIVLNFLMAYQGRNLKAFMFLVVYVVIFSLLNSQLVRNEFED